MDQEHGERLTRLAGQGSTTPDGQEAKPRADQNPVTIMIEERIPYMRTKRRL